MKRILTFVIFAAVLLVLVGRLTTTAYGADSPAQQDIRIESAAAADAPQTVFFGNAHGSITAGDLFYVDLQEQPRDVRANIYITNADNLARSLRYMVLNIGVYVKNENGGWDKCAGDSSRFLTLTNGLTEITLPGPGYFKITVDSGNYYSFPWGNNQGLQAPLFSLEVES